MDRNGDPILQADAPAKEFSTERCLQCGWEREEYEERIRFLENRVRLQDAELQGKEDRIRGLKDRIQALEDQIKVLQKRPARPKIRPSGLARDACLGALKTCQKLESSFWGVLNNRLGIAGAPEVPRLAELIRSPPES